MQEQSIMATRLRHVLTDVRLTPVGRLTYAGLLSFVDGDQLAYPGHNALAIRCGTSVRSVIRSFQALVEYGHIVVQRMGSGRPNIVTLIGIETAESPQDLTAVDRLWDYLRPQISPVIFARDGHVCLACGIKTDLTVDHVVPRALGGTNDLANLQTLCLSCNQGKRRRVIDYRLPVAIRDAAGLD